MDNAFDPVKKSFRKHVKYIGPDTMNEGLESLNSKIKQNEKDTTYLYIRFKMSYISFF